MEWIIAGSVFGVVFVLLALLLRIIPKSGSDEKPKDEKDGKKPPESEQPPAAPATPPASAQPATGASRSGHGHGSPIGKAISWTIVLVFWAGLGLAGYWIWTQINDGRQQQLAEVSQPRAASAARTTSVRYDTDTDGFCAVAPQDASNHPASPREWIQIDVPHGKAICMSLYNTPAIAEMECRRGEGRPWRACGKDFASIRFKSTTPGKTWFEPFRRL